MNELSEFVGLMNRLERTYDQFPNKAATLAVNFSKERFRDQAWLDSTKKAWPKRKRQRKSKKREKGAVLVDTGRLRRSIRKVKVGRDYAIIGTDVPYAQVHNDGGTIKGIVKVKTHSRRRFGTAKKGTGVYNVRTRKERTRKVTAVVGTSRVMAHMRKVNFRMPQRQFLGQSATLDKRIQLMISSDIMKAFKNTMR